LFRNKISEGAPEYGYDDRKADSKDGRHHGRDDELDDAFEKGDSIMSR
jgi:hypothetical protein